MENFNTHMENIRMENSTSYNSNISDGKFSYVTMPTRIYSMHTDIPIWKISLYDYLMPSKAQPNKPVRNIIVQNIFIFLYAYMEYYHMENCLCYAYAYTYAYVCNISIWKIQRKEQPSYTRNNTHRTNNSIRPHANTRKNQTESCLQLYTVYIYMENFQTEQTK